ncbi:hypothetical protein [Flavobacterium lipolyticum]|uniref:EF-hand domain-containing protein n=1 Tax=Flavobacterium lipolyticum TaxID=2893754 RepID=A0ABS8M1B9_9FLAO|nr:hypothetical protein [Flavobacterium sp. F-126]MCC9018645.1 hypothetical protein [Flavobacterium sp. F-126]
MQEEEERFVQIIKDSNRKLVILELLSNFFSHKDFVGVLIKTRIIHTLFENNKALDINKLELFHVQFTSSFIELFQKLKKAKEQQYLLISDEIYINEDIITKLKSEIDESGFAEKAKTHARNMSRKIEELYNMFATENEGFFSWNEIISFSDHVKQEYFREIALEEYEKIDFLNKKLYENKHVKFEKKLLGRLNILKFKIKFLCGLVCNNEVIEVFEFRDSNDKFIFIANEKAFYLLDDVLAKEINIAKNDSVKGEIITQLREKNSALTFELSTIKTSFPENVDEVLKEYLDKISSVDFVEDLQNVDEQTNILRTMLNINIK